MQPPKILIQLDSDPHPSVFDAVVAHDAGVERLLQYGNVTASNVIPLAHGAMFTRGPEQLKNSAIFIGGSDVETGEAIAQTIQQAFFGPIRVSVMSDGNGSNTTASAAVLCAARHVDVAGCKALVLGGTGPVGARAALLLARQGATVYVVSRDLRRAEETCSMVAQQLGSSLEGELIAVSASEPDTFTRAIEAAEAVFGCGAAGVTLLSETQLESARSARVAIDLNAVPPAGLEGVSATDKATVRGRRADYGAIGVGGLKMKIHRTAIARLFDSNEQFLGTEQIFDIGQALEAER